jgi:hypothetical protein
MKASIVKATTDLTTISYTAKGQEQARTCLQAVIDQLANSQDELSSSRKRQLQGQLASQQTAIKEMEKYDVELKQALLKNGLSNKTPAESALLLYGLQSKENLLREARKLAIEMSAALEQPITQKLTPLEPIYTSFEPVSPNHWLFAFIGLFLGVIICAVFCWREIIAIIQSDEDH